MEWAVSPHERFITKILKKLCAHKKPKHGKTSCGSEKACIHDKRRAWSSVLGLGQVIVCSENAYNLHISYFGSVCCHVIITSPSYLINRWHIIELKINTFGALRTIRHLVVWTVPFVILNEIAVWTGPYRNIQWLAEARAYTYTVSNSISGVFSQKGLCLGQLLPILSPFSTKLMF